MKDKIKEILDLIIEKEKIGDIDNLTIEYLNPESDTLSIRVDKNPMEVRLDVEESGVIDCWIIIGETEFLFSTIETPGLKNELEELYTRTYILIEGDEVELTPEKLDSLKTALLTKPEIIDF